jgi:hypothetical protein
MMIRFIYNRPQIKTFAYRCAIYEGICVVLYHDMKNIYEEERIY